MRVQRTRLFILMVLVVASCLGILCRGLATPDINPVTVSRAAALTPEETAYLRFMYPRLVSLQEEIDSLSTLVDERSRNLIALQGHRTRIKDLSDQITQWQTMHTVPPGFQDSNTRLMADVNELTVLMVDAEGALRRFDFSGVAALVPRFETVHSQLSQIEAELRPFVLGRNATYNGTGVLWNANSVDLVPD